MSQSEKAYQEKDYRKVVYLIGRAIQHSPSCTQFSVLKAECLALLGRYQEAQEIAKLDHFYVLFRYEYFVNNF